MGAVIPRHDDRLEKSKDLLVESKTYIRTVIIVTMWVSCCVPHNFNNKEIFDRTTLV